jgi:hypothetical protein
MKHFYHGTSFDFDAFDDSKVVTNGPIGACENGRGTYLTADYDFAQGWETRNNGPSPHSVRIDVSEAAWEQNFIHHDKTFSQKDAVNLAVAAATRGYDRAAEDIAHLICCNREKNGDSSFTAALTGRDLAMASRYNLEVVHLLNDLGYTGFKYTEPGYKGPRDNIVFFHAQDIPAMTPMDLRKDRFDALLQAGDAATADTQDLEKPLSEIFKRIDTVFADSGIDVAKATAAKQDILKLAQLATATEEYDPLKSTHPLKFTELVLVVHGGQGMREKMRIDAGNFVQEGMALLGHSFKNPTFEARTAAIPDANDNRFQPDGSINAFKKRLADKDYIASEELSRAHRRIKTEHPALLKQFDRLIDKLHAPGVDFSLRDAMGHAVNRALNGQFTPESGETTLSNLNQNLSYNASTCRRDLRETVSDAVRFGDVLKHNLGVIDVTPAQPAHKTQMKPA